MASQESKLSKLKYFFPDSQDFIDPSFDFFRETRNEHRVRQRDDQYPHEVFPHPYDGMLVSKAVVDGLGGGESKYTRAQRLRYFRNGMKHFFRLPENMETMGDCGAFTYVNQDVPPYRVEEVIEFYETSRFNHGVSLDHIVFGYEKPGEVFSGEVLAECRRRQDITLTLAQEFLNKSQKSCFTPFGVAHGWSKTSYRQSVEALLAMGYRNITMGGMVPLKTAQILETLEEIKPLLKSDTRIHLLGIARPESFADFIKFGVTSIDSTTPLQQAFKDRKNRSRAARVALRGSELRLEEMRSAESRAGSGGSRPRYGCRSWNRGHPCGVTFPLLYHPASWLRIPCLARHFASSSEGARGHHRGARGSPRKNRLAAFPAGVSRQHHEPEGTGFLYFASDPVHQYRRADPASVL